MREWPDAMVKSQENDGPAVNAGEAADPGRRRRDFESMRVVIVPVTTSPTGPMPVVC
jgi:hypothetical protein